MESRACIAEALFACCKSAEVGCGLGDDVVIKFELDATPVFHCLVLVSLNWDERVDLPWPPAVVYSISKYGLDMMK